MVKKIDTPKHASRKRAKVISKTNLQYVQVTKIPKDLFTIAPTNLFEALIYPLTKKDFFDTIFRKQAFIISSPKSRLTKVKESLFDLNLDAMLQNTASEMLHVWQPTKTGINSYSTDSWEEAADAYNNKRASLYFGSSL